VRLYHVTNSVNVFNYSLLILQKHPAFIIDNIMNKKNVAAPFELPRPLFIRIAVIFIYIAVIIELIQLQVFIDLPFGYLN